MAAPFAGRERAGHRIIVQPTALFCIDPDDFWPVNARRTRRHRRAAGPTVRSRRRTPTEHCRAASPCQLGVIVRIFSRIGRTSPRRTFGAGAVLACRSSGATVVVSSGLLDCFRSPSPLQQAFRSSLAVRVANSCVPVAIIGIGRRASRVVTRLSGKRFDSSKTPTTLALLSQPRYRLSPVTVVGLNPTPLMADDASRCGQATCAAEQSTTFDVAARQGKAGERAAAGSRVGQRSSRVVDPVDAALAEARINTAVPPAAGERCTDRRWATPAFRPTSGVFALTLKRVEIPR